MDNAAFTFEQLLYKAVEDNPGNAASAIEKAKYRVLKVRQFFIKPSDAAHIHTAQLL